MAILVPPLQSKAERSLSGIEGWLEEDDPFFEIVDGWSGTEPDTYRE